MTPLRLDHHSGEPIYRQIVEQVKYRVACGRLTPGEQLPSIRALAEQLRINPRTVVKAYEELQHAGLVSMCHGRGVFVSENHGSVAASARRAALGEMAKRMLTEAIRMGGDMDEVIKAVESQAKQMEQDR